MGRVSPKAAESEPDTGRAVRLAPGIWWVGSHILRDSLQCNVYLVEAGRQSILIDPGSALVADRTIAKIREVMPLEHIRYFVCQHSDPDIIGALPIIRQAAGRKDAVLVTHWRSEMLAKHLGLGMPFWRIEEHGWTIKADDRRLDFILTPYLHFPGAFCTFDRRTGTLFTSDLFGAMGGEWRLFAKDEGHFVAMRTFHEHYMPSREILASGLASLERLPMRMIAPQHGSIIRKPLIPLVFNRLKSLECGLYRFARHDTRIQRLMAINAILRKVGTAIVIYRDFASVVAEIRSTVGRLVPVKSIEFWTSPVGGSPREAMCFAAETRYRGEVLRSPKWCRDILGMSRKAWDARYGKSYLIRRSSRGITPLLVPLFGAEDGRASGIAVLRFDERPADLEGIERLVDELAAPFAAALERETIHRSLEIEREEIHERAIRDPLTGLYTRLHVKDAVGRMMQLHEREPRNQLALLMVDIDHFKKINDTFGHLAGDEALKAVAAVLLASCRKTDVPVRFGGEEFAIFLSGHSARNAEVLAERIRSRVEAMALPGRLAGRPITVSIGIARHRSRDKLDGLIARADRALYRAKEMGRNRVVVTP